MDKRKLENNRVKESIEIALFELLKEKPFSEISISDITRRANVARTSYYRNFSSKESILTNFIERLHQEVGTAISHPENEKQMFTIENIIISLDYYLKFKDYILVLYDHGFGKFLQEEVNAFAENLLGDMPADSLDRYRLYFISGGMLNTGIQWLKNGAKESPTMIAETFFELLSKDLTKTIDL